MKAPPIAPKYNKIIFFRAETKIYFKPIPRQKNSQSEWTRIFYCAALPLPKEIKAA